MVDVAVVIPTRDRPQLVATAVAAALAQQGVSVEVVVVDDGSDVPVTVEADRRVRVVRLPSSRGVAGARNAGVAAADAPWVAFLDDDDLWAPDKLARQLEAMASTGRRWAYTGDVYVDERLVPVLGAPPPDPHAVVVSLRRYNAMPAGGSSVVVDAGLVAADPFDEALRRTEDWDLWLRLARHGEPASVPEPLVACRLHAGNAPVDVDDMVAEATILEARHGIAVDRNALLRRAAWTALRAGRRRQAARYYGQAIRGGDVRSVARLAAALGHPAPGRLHELVGRRRRDEAWMARAEPWLAPLRGPSA